MAGIAHFSRFFVYMETAEHQFLNAVGTSVHTDIDGQHIGWPRLAARCEYFRPVRFEDWLDIEVLVARKGRRSMTYQVEFRHQEETVARGTISSACCVIEAGQRPRAIDIPAQIADGISQAPAEEIVPLRGAR